MVIIVIRSTLELQQLHTAFIFIISSCRNTCKARIEVILRQGLHFQFVCERKLQNSRLTSIACSPVVMLTGRGQDGDMKRDQSGHWSIRAVFSNSKPCKTSAFFWRTAPQQLTYCHFLPCTSSGVTSCKTTCCGVVAVWCKEVASPPDGCWKAGTASDHHCLNIEKFLHKMKHYTLRYNIHCSLVARTACWVRSSLHMLKVLRWLK